MQNPKHSFALYIAYIFYDIIFYTSKIQKEESNPLEVVFSKKKINKIKVLEKIVFGIYSW